jgi:hypothetical protein
MPDFRSNEDETLQGKLAATKKLVEEAEKLIRAQEEEVARMRSAGLDTRHAEGLLEAYRESARIALKEHRELETEIARRRSA